MPDFTKAVRLPLPMGMHLMVGDSNLCVKGVVYEISPGDLIYHSGMIAMSMAINTLINTWGNQVNLIVMRRNAAENIDLSVMGHVVANFNDMEFSGSLMQLRHLTSQPNEPKLPRIVALAFSRWPEDSEQLRDLLDVIRQMRSRGWAVLVCEHVSPIVPARLLDVLEDVTLRVTR